MFTSFNPVDKYTTGQTGCIKGYLMPAGLTRFIQECLKLLAQHIVDGQPNMRLLRQVKMNLCGRIEGIGVVLM